MLVGPSRGCIGVNHHNDGLVQLPLVSDRRELVPPKFSFFPGDTTVGGVGHEQPSIPEARVSTYQQDTWVFVRNLKVARFKKVWLAL